MVNVYDVIVLGAGPAGLATALAVKGMGNYRVLVADAGRPQRERVGETVPPDILMPLRRLQLEQSFLTAGHLQSPGSAVCWGRDAIGYNDQLLNPMGPAWRLNRGIFDAMLARAATERGIQVYWNTRYLRSAAVTEGYAVTLAQQGHLQQTLHTRWVVDATGPLARFAHHRGVKKQVHDLLFAQAAYSEILAGDMRKQILVEARPEGWWYAAYLPGNRLLHLFVTDTAPLRQLKAAGMAGWQALLARTRLVGPAVAGLQLAPPQFYTWPVYSSLLQQAYGPYWLAVGDAAAAYDPLVSQGLYKALGDGVAAGQALVAALQDNELPLQAYNAAVQQRYERYFLERCGLYGQEQRWPQAVFWQKRWAVC